MRAVHSVTKGPARRTGRPRPPGTAASQLGADLEREALVIDRRLVAVSKLGIGERRRALEHISTEVARIERLAHRVTDLVRDEQARPALVPGGSALDDLTDRVDRLEQARADLTVIETEARLSMPPELSA